MKVVYHINLGNYVTKKNFNSAYHKEIILNDELEIVSSKVELLGYFPYKIFDDEDKKRVEEKYKEELKETMEELISKVNKRMSKLISLLHNDKNIEAVNLQPYKEGEFTVYGYIKDNK